LPEEFIPTRIDLLTYLPSLKPLKISEKTVPDKKVFLFLFYKPVVGIV